MRRRLSNIYPLSFSYALLLLLHTFILPLIHLSVLPTFFGKASLRKTSSLPTSPTSQPVSLLSLSLSLSSVFPFGGRTHARAPRRRPPSRARTDPLTLSSRRSPPPLPPPSVPTRDSPTYLVQPESLRSRLSAIRPSPVRRRVADSGELPPLRSAPAAIASGERRCGGR